MKERDVKAYVYEKAKAVGAEVRKVSYEGRRAAPDLIIGFPEQAHAVFVELKRPGKKPRPSQEREMARMKTWGLHVTWVDCPEAVDELFDEILNPYEDQT